MVEDIQGLFEAVRDACSRAAWSKGVELARGNAVVGERAEPDAVVLKVATAGALIARTVVLQPQDEDWTCACDGQADACAHVAAATIALRRARQSGQSMPEAPAALARIRYLFQRAEGALLFARAFVRDGKAEPFEVNLSSI